MSREGNILVPAAEELAGSSVAVVMPVYNGEQYLAAALESVLKQTRPADEIFVIDDGSTDGSVAIARSFAGVEVIVQKNAGVSASRNRGTELARSEWIAFLDQDDMWEPQKLERQLAAVAADEATDLCLTGYRVLTQFGDGTEE